MERSAFITTARTSSWQQTKGKFHPLLLVKYCTAVIIRLTNFVEQLTGAQLVKKIAAFYGTSNFINLFTTAR
jgi:hypothetical protein